ncbi:MAG: EamA family transporter [Streptosporangiales bacterium]|nr:EamA family transporter [Streptosporangiales bacterium]
MVLVAAVAHASWNAIAHDIDDKLVSFTLVGLGGAVCSLVVVAVAPLPHRDSWPYLLTSALVHVAYFALLMKSYELGEFSQVYPLARGTSPLVVTVLAAVFVREVPPPFELAGVLVVSVGLGTLVLAGGRPGRRDLPALAAAVGTGLTIAAYTTIDGIGVRASGNAAAYTGWLILLQSLPIPLYALARRRRALIRQLRPQAVRGLAGGVLSLLAYGLVLWAQTRGALAPIAALRETSIIVGAVIGTIFFAEPFGRSRVVATVVVVGIVLISLA